jgi:KipI family sensor histidine kinase inhibitor
MADCGGKLNRPAQPGHGKLRVLWLADRGVTLELPEADPERVLGLAEEVGELMRQGLLPGAEEVLPAMRSVTLYVDPLRFEPDRSAALLAALPAAPRPHKGRRVSIPVCFDAEFAPDLDGLARARSMTSRQFADQFMAAPVSARMLGFLPGFAYLGDLPRELRAPRLATPRKAVPAGSLAIAGANCAIYPWESPGGWNLIGRTPIRMFDPDDPQDPSLLQPGDEVTWQEIGRRQFDHWPKE